MILIFPVIVWIDLILFLTSLFVKYSFTEDQIIVTIKTLRYNT